jgi:putative chitinase
MLIKPIQLSEHFTLAEATFSSTADRLGIDNSCTDDAIIAKAILTAISMERVRALLANPIHIDSWIRCLKLNRALHSKDTSQHPLGEAVDFLCPAFGTPAQIAHKIVDNATIIGYDQLIMEYSWVHISFSERNRREVLSLLRTGDYTRGITDLDGNPC